MTLKEFMEHLKDKTDSFESELSGTPLNTTIDTWLQIFQQHLTYLEEKK